jgi:hypothetical protein
MRFPGRFGSGTNSSARFVLKRAAAVVLVAVVSLLLLEWSVRLLMPAYDPAGQISFARIDGVPLGPPGFDGRLWRNTGDFEVSVRINEHGLRDRKDLSRSVAGDLFVVGDSFSFGWGVEERERFSDRIEDLFDRPCYNIAIPTDFDGYRRLIGHAAANGAVIDRLIVGVCMENDLKLYPPPSESVAPPEYHHRLLSWRRLKFYLTKYSAFYSAATAVVHQNPALRGFMGRIGWVTDSVDGMNWNFYSPEIIEKSTRRLIRLIDESDARQCVVLLIPSRGLWQGDNGENERRVHAEFASSLAARGLDVIDMKPLLEAGGDPLAYHFESDGHWNAAAHDLAAKAVYDYCRSHRRFGMGVAGP